MQRILRHPELPRLRPRDIGDSICAFFRITSLTSFAVKRFGSWQSLTGIGGHNFGSTDSEVFKFEAASLWSKNSAVARYARIQSLLRSRSWISSGIISFYSNIFWITWVQRGRSRNAAGSALHLFAVFAAHSISQRQGYRARALTCPLRAW
jgi:hypothetical protein